MDVLTDVMQTLRVRSHLYGRAEFTAPWGISVPREPGHAGFFVISRGSCWLETDGLENPAPLAGGDFVFFPHGGPYRLRDALDSPVTAVEEIESVEDSRGRVCTAGGGGAPTSAVWGCFEFEDGGRNPLIESLPPVIHLTAEAGPSVQWLQSTLQFVTSEISSGLPGAETVANRLTDILFVHAIRAHISGCAAHGCRANGWLRALADPKIGGALRLIHQTPQNDWTVDSLARAVAMSRSAFAAKFTTLVGESPLRYVTAWRMCKATDMLLRGDPISVIARTVGYDTDAAFGKAFKKHVGLAPGEFRRRSRETAVSHSCPDVQAAPRTGRRAAERAPAS
ncbi:MAG TPA: AraC family transcriptional regulator [Phycisphaerales bacterium]|nr:AraC family transcriptional regulator [Phycisphaerales bacterium]